MGKSVTLSPQKRLRHIDVLRGVAILGILLVNMAHFSYPDLYLQMVGPENFFNETWRKVDYLITTCLNMFVQMKFITMFSFLFGFGMMMMKERIEAKKNKYIPILIRRLLVLFIIGGIHAFFIWDGDVLMDYAILGFIFLFFLKRSPKTLLIWSVVLYLIFTLLLVMTTAVPVEETTEAIQWQAKAVSEGEHQAKQALQIYASGTFSEVVNQRIQDRMYYMSLNGMASLNPLLYLLANIPYFSMFLLGGYIVKKKVLHELGKHKKVLKKMWMITLIIGLPTNIVFGLNNQEILLLIGAPFLMMFYIISLVFLLEMDRSKKILQPFAAVGRTAFSNYILQSFIATTIFYSYGLGLYGKVMPLHGLLLSIIIFIVQLIISNLWLKKFQYGPLEWLWRGLTYKKFPSFTYK